MPKYVRWSNDRKNSILEALKCALTLSINNSANIVISKIKDGRKRESDYIECYFHHEGDYKAFKEKGYYNLVHGKKIFSETNALSKNEKYIAIIMHNSPEDIKIYDRDNNCIEWIYLPFSERDVEDFLKIKDDAFHGKEILCID